MGSGGRWDEDWDNTSRDGTPEQTDDDDWAGRGPSKRAKVILAMALGAAMLVSLVLCCVLAGEAGQLLWLEIPPP